MNRPFVKIVFLSFLIAICFFKDISCASAVGNVHVDSLKAALKVSKDDTNKVKLLLAIADSIGLDDTVSGLRYTKLALTLAESRQWYKGIILANKYLGTEYIYYRHDTSGLYYYLRALSYCKKIDEKFEQANIDVDLGNIFDSKKDASKALYYFMEAIKNGNGINFTAQYLAYLNGGSVYSNLNDFPRAIKSCQLALELVNMHAKELSVLKDVFTVKTIILNNIGALYMEMGQNSKAMTYFDTLLEMNKEVNDTPTTLSARLNRGEAYIRMKDFSKAIDEFHICSKYLSSNYRQRFYLSNIYLGLSNGYEGIGELTKARSYADSILIIAHKKKDVLLEANAFFEYAKIYSDLKQYKESLEYYAKALSIQKSHNNIKDQRDILQSLSNTYSKMDLPAEAFEAYRQYINLRDSLSGEEKQRDFTRNEMQYEFDKRQVEDSIKEATEKNILSLRLQRQKAYTYSGAAGICLLGLLSFFIFKNYSQQKTANSIITREKQKSEELLLNILPGEVADELKLNGSVQAKAFEEVTILFTDFVNFTSAGERLSPHELVSELDSCFKAFDGIITKYGIEKIKTVGDAYLTVCGLPSRNVHHAENVVKAAIEIRDYILMRKTQDPEHSFEVRIGLHSGSVVAGIVGVKKFAYDIWGDTVNTAARMEQNSTAGKINISETTYQLVKDKFVCIYRGEIDAKNKGMLKMYFVESNNG